jgi:hypothetical protein
MSRHKERLSLCLLSLLLLSLTHPAHPSKDKRPPRLSALALLPKTPPRVPSPRDRHRRSQSALLSSLLLIPLPLSVQTTVHPRVCR